MNKYGAMFAHLKEKKEMRNGVEVIWWETKIDGDIKIDTNELLKKFHASDLFKEYEKDMHDQVEIVNPDEQTQGMSEEKAVQQASNRKLVIKDRAFAEYLVKTTKAKPRRVTRIYYVPQKSNELYIYIPDSPQEPNPKSTNSIRRHYKNNMEKTLPNLTGEMRPAPDRAASILYFPQSIGLPKFFQLIWEKFGIEFTSDPSEIVPMEFLKKPDGPRAGQKKSDKVRKKPSKNKTKSTENSGLNHQASAKRRKIVVEMKDEGEGLATTTPVVSPAVAAAAAIPAAMQEEPQLNVAVAAAAASTVAMQQEVRLSPKEIATATAIANAIQAAHRAAAFDTMRRPAACPRDPGSSTDLAQRNLGNSSGLSSPDVAQRNPGASPMQIEMKFVPAPIASPTLPMPLFNPLLPIADLPPALRPQVSPTSIAPLDATVPHSLSLSPNFILGTAPIAAAAPKPVLGSTSIAMQLLRNVPRAALAAVHSVEAAAIQPQLPKPVALPLNPGRFPATGLHKVSLLSHPKPVTPKNAAELLLSLSSLQFSGRK